MIFKKYADFKFFSVEGLKKISNFMGLQPVTGFNIINNVLAIVRLKIPIDAPGIRLISHTILVRELNMYFARIRKEDESISFNDLNSFSEEEIDAICFRRGIEIDRNSLKDKKQDLKLWLSVSN